jgi:multiple antibiotic resistance protein
MIWHFFDLDIAILIRTFVAVFVLADAPGNAPIFLALTKGMEPGQRQSVVNRATIVATVILLLFAFGGQLVLEYLHISVGSLRVAGGLLLLLIALKMLDGEVGTPLVEEGRDVAITPLALPLLAGPGTLTAVMLMMADATTARLSVVIGIVAAMLVTWLIVRLAAQIDHLIGAEGAIIITQLSGFLLAALGIEIGSEGIRELFLIH